MMKMLVSTLVAVIAAQSPTPQRAVDELLDADRAFSTAASTRTPVEALSAMFADTVTLPTPRPKPGFARGKADAHAALEANPLNLAGRLEWSPVRGGVSADGQHGFTIGYMTHTTDGRTQYLKYVAYWTKQAGGWKLAAYRRTPADQAPSSTAVMPPALPSAIMAPTSDVAAVARHKSSLESAEKAFSDEAQKIGLGPAFAKHGSPDAVNVGPPATGDFVVGAEAIGKSVGSGSEGKPSPVTWAADEGSIVASSGDLGVTFGYIRQNAPTPGQPSVFPFFTIWRRSSVDAPWRYVAE